MAPPPIGGASGFRLPSPIRHNPGRALRAGGGILRAMAIEPRSLDLPPIEGLRSVLLSLLLEAEKGLRRLEGGADPEALHDFPRHHLGESYRQG